MHVRMHIQGQERKDQPLTTDVCGICEHMLVIGLAQIISVYQ